MGLREDILREYSKSHTVKIAEQIGPNQENFDELMQLFLGDEYRVTQRAAWIISHCADEYPWLINKHIEPLLLNLKNPVGDPVKRNTVRVLRYVDIPEDLVGIAADICFGFLLSGKEPIAVKVHSMDVIFNIVRKFPELKDELRRLNAVHGGMKGIHDTSPVIPAGRFTFGKIDGFAAGVALAVCQDQHRH